MYYARVELNFNRISETLCSVNLPLCVLIFVGCDKLYITMIAIKRVDAMPK